MLRIELNIGTLCNFKCKYCFENTPNKKTLQTSISYETVERFCEYIKYIDRTYNKDMYLVIFGGEPLLQINVLFYIIKQISKCFKDITIVSNGYFIANNISNILKLIEISDCKIMIPISYDYILQNKNRHNNTYNIIRNSIRLGYYYNFSRGTNTVFDSSNINYIDDCFFDFIKLREELSDLHFGFSLDRYDKNFKNVDLKTLKKKLKKIREYFEYRNIKDFSNIFFINTFSGYGYTRLSSIHEGRFFNDIHISMTYNGNLYPGYELETEPEHIKKMLYISNIFDDFDIIEKNRIDLLNKLPQTIPDKCKICTARCRVVPWLTIKNNISEYNSYGNEGICKIHKLISEVLYDNK